MRLGITAKLFLAILTVNIILIGGLTWSARQGLETGFLSYVNKVEAKRLERLVGALARAYDRYGGWGFLRRDYLEWSRLLRNFETNQFSTLPLNLWVGGEAPDYEARLTLLDENKRRILGKADPLKNATVYPIRRNDVVVGYLVISPSQQLTDALDREFQQRQAGLLPSLAGTAIVIAAIAALLLARLFLAPVRRLGNATDQLRRGNFQTRVGIRQRDEFGQLADDFNSLAATLEQNEQLRRELTADIAHELRTPLAVLRAELDAVEDGVRELNTDTLASLQHEVERLSKLVSDLNSLALSDAGALSYRCYSTDLTILLRELIEQYAARCAAAGIEVRSSLPHAPAMVSLDPERFEQLLTNLLENSLRYTDSDGELRIGLRRDGNEWQLDIEDSAPGVSDEALPRLFDRLYRAEESRNRASGGSGLGLAIARKIAEAHNGSITATHSPLGGVRMTIRLPATGSRQKRAGSGHRTSQIPDQTARNKA